MLKCPNCGSEKVQLTVIEDKKKHHSILWTILFGWIYWTYRFMVWMFKITIGTVVFLCWDSWCAIIKKIQNKGYTWISKRFFINSKKKNYYCHECGMNFYK